MQPAQATLWLCVLLITFSNFVSSLASIDERDPTVIIHHIHHVDTSSDTDSDSGESVIRQAPVGPITQQAPVAPVQHLVQKGQPVLHDFVQKRRPILHQWLERRPSIHNVVADIPILHDYVVPRAPLHYFVKERQIHHLAPFIRTRARAGVQGPLYGPRPRYYRHVPKKQSIDRLKRIMDEYDKAHTSRKDALVRMKSVMKEARGKSI
eukprot:625495_1